MCNPVSGLTERVNPEDLPSASAYCCPFKDRAEVMMLGKTNPPGQHSAEQYAKNVVDELLRYPESPPPFVRRVYLATSMWIVS